MRFSSIWSQVFPEHLFIFTHSTRSINHINRHKAEVMQHLYSHYSHIDCSTINEKLQQVIGNPWIERAPLLTPVVSTGSDLTFASPSKRAAVPLYLSVWAWSIIKAVDNPLRRSGCLGFTHLEPFVSLLRAGCCFYSKSQRPPSKPRGRETLPPFRCRGSRVFNGRLF